MLISKSVQNSQLKSKKSRAGSKLHEDKNARGD